MNGLRLRSNPATLLAYRNLTQTQFGLNNTLQRLSSGLRINKAADDSAGSAISTRMSNQIRGMKQANENSQQANNLIQTAESGLNDISGILSRMRELATQAATDTLNTSDRASINLEFQTLKNEISRVAHATEYNEMNLLNGTDYKNEVHRANTTADDVIGISVKNANLSHDIRKGIYTLSDEHIDVSGLADISNLSDTAITGIRYSSSSVQPALGETYTIKSQVNSGLADIDGLSSTSVSQLQHSTSPIVLPGDHTLIASLNASDKANISNLSGTAITGISHDASSVVQPGDHMITASLNAGTTNISNMSGTSIRHDTSTTPGTYTLSLSTSASPGTMPTLSTTVNGNSMGNIDLMSGLGTVTGSMGASSAYAAAFDTDGSKTLYTLIDGLSGNARLATVNLATGQATTVSGPGTGTDMITLEVAEDGTMYGVGFNDRQLYRIDKATGVATAIGDTQISDTMDLAFDSSGTLWATVDNKLWTIDLTTGTSTLQTNISGITSGSVMGIMFDATDTLFATAYTGNSPFYKIDTASGVASVIANNTTLSSPHGGDILLGMAATVGEITITPPSGETVQKATYNYTSSPQTVDFPTLGIHIDIDDGTTLADQLSSSQVFIVNPKLAVTAPDGTTTQEIPYSYSSQPQTISFDDLGLTVNTSNASDMTAALLGEPQDFTVDTRLKVTAPNGTFQEILYSSSLEEQTVNFSNLGLTLDSNNAQTTAKSLLNNTKDFTINPTLSVTAPDNTVHKSVYDFNSNSQKINFSGLGLQVETDNATTMTSALFNNAKNFIVDARLTATAPNGAIEEVKYPSSSQAQTVSFGTLGLDVDSDNAQTTANQLLDNSKDFTVNPTLAVNSPNTGPVEEIGYQFHSSPQTIDFSRLGLEVDTNEAPKTTTTLLGSSQDFFVPETRKLTMTGENGLQQSLEYRVGYDTTLNFDEFGIQLDINGSPDYSTPSIDSYNPHTDSLDGKQIEIAPNRDLQVGFDNDINHQLKLGITSVTASGLEIEDESVADINQARLAITSLDMAIDVVNQERSYLGAEQNRLAFTMSNLTNQTQSIETSRSSIQDADFASDAASLAKTQILAQSATAMLAQANAISQNILSLISA